MGNALTQQEMLEEMQEHLGTRVDGDFARHSTHCLYLNTIDKNKIKFPYSIKAFGQWLHVTTPEKFNPFDPNGAKIGEYLNVVSGSYSYNGEPTSIMISDGEVIRKYSCHSFLGLPEKVLYFKDGEYHTAEVISTDELPDGIVWAVGGAGFLDGEAEREGFCLIETEDGHTYHFYDVWEYRPQMVLVPDRWGYVNVIEFAAADKEKMIRILEYMGYDVSKAVKIDGGTVAASNMPDHKKLTNKSQNYMLFMGD